MSILPFDDLANEDKFEFINELLELDEQVIKNTDHNNDSLSNKELHIEKGDKFSVDSFVWTIKCMAGLFADLKVYQTLSWSYEARTVIEIPGGLRGMAGVNKIVVDSDRDKEHIKWISLYGDFKEDEDDTIPRLLFGEYNVFLHYIDQKDGEQKLDYRVIENHLNSIEKEAVRHFIAFIKKEYGDLFRLNIEDVFNDVFPTVTVAEEYPNYLSVLAGLPAEFKEDFCRRLLDDIPLSSSDLDLNRLTRLFGEIVQNRLITLPYYRHFCVILNLLNSELRKYIKHDGINHLTGTCFLYADEEPDYSAGADIQIDSYERYGKKGVTNLTGTIGITHLIIHEEKLKCCVGEDCLSILDNLANPDFGSSFLAAEPLKEFLWWGSIGGASFLPRFPNKLDEDGCRFISVEYEIKERVPSNSFLNHKPSSPVSEKGVARFMDQLCRQLSIVERETTIVTENREKDGELSTVIELPNFKHYYKTITLTYHDKEHIEGVMLSGVKLYEIANSYSGSFLGFHVTLIMERTDSLFQYLFLKVL